MCFGAMMRKKMTHKLSDEQKQEIIKLLKNGYSPSDIAQKYNISRITVYNIGRKSNEKT